MTTYRVTCWGEVLKTAGWTLDFSLSVFSLNIQNLTHSQKKAAFPEYFFFIGLLLQGTAGVIHLIITGSLLLINRCFLVG
jgi:hypothetical protein